MEIKTIDLDKVDPNTVIVKDPQVEPPKIIKNNMSSKSSIITVVIFLVTAIAGFYSGATLKSSTSGKMVGASGELKNIQAEIPTTGVKVGDIYGSADEKIFKDSATGVIDKGGFNGEGTHKLVRPGGPDQTVYITSSVVDLDTIVGDQVTIWGETFKGQKVGWLMDVGRVKVENLNMPLPK